MLLYDEEGEEVMSSSWNTKVIVNNNLGIGWNSRMETNNQLWNLYNTPAPDVASSLEKTLILGKMEDKRK